MLLLPALQSPSAAKPTEYAVPARDRVLGQHRAGVIGFLHSSRQWVVEPESQNAQRGRAYLKPLVRGGRPQRRGPPRRPPQERRTAGREIRQTAQAAVVRRPRRRTLRIAVGLPGGSRTSAADRLRCAAVRRRDWRSRSPSGSRRSNATSPTSRCPGSAPMTGSARSPSIPWDLQYGVRSRQSSGSAPRCGWLSGSPSP
jgi:hypothetical protein